MTRLRASFKLLFLIVSISLRNSLVHVFAGVVVVCENEFVVKKQTKCAKTGVVGGSGTELRFLKADEDVVATRQSIDDDDNSLKVGIVEIQVPSERGEYRLAVFDGQSRTYESLTKVRVRDSGDGDGDRDAVFFVETDKALYAPGQFVRIRVLGANATEIRALSIATTVNVTVKDSLDRLLFKRDDVALDVFGLCEFEVSVAKEQPPFGQWVVYASSGTANAFAYFNVEEYVLPSFDIKIESNSVFIAAKDENDILATISAKYTYGKSVEGLAKVILKKPEASNSNFYSGGGGVAVGAADDVRFANPSEFPGGGTTSGYSDIIFESDWIALNSDGSIDISSKITKNVIDSIYGTEIILIATVEETATKEIRNSSSITIPVIREAFFDSQTTSTPAMKPGLPLSKTVQLKTNLQNVFKSASSNGSDFGTLDFSLYVNSMNSFSKTAKSTVISVPVSSSGRIEFEIDVPANTQSCCSSYADEISYGSGKCCLNSMNVQLEKNAASRDVVKRMLSASSATIDVNALTTSQLDAMIPYLSVYFSRDVESAKASLEVVISDEKCESNTTCGFKIASTKSNVIFAFAVVDSEGLGRGVLESGTISFSSSEVSKTVSMSYSSIASTSSARCSIVVWLISGSVYGESYLSGTTSQIISVPGTAVSLAAASFAYDIGLNMNVSETNTVTTGTSTEFYVSGAPNGSRAYILAIDEAVIVQSAGNTSAIDATDFLSKIYDSRMNLVGSDAKTWPCADMFVKKDISLDRVTIISSAELPSYCDPSNIWGGFGVVNDMMFGVGVGMAENSLAAVAPQGGENMKTSTSSSETASASAVRTLFPETWLWDYSDTGLFETKAPDSITTWSITAFTSHPTNGISILKNASKLTVFREFFISPKLPYSITRGETVEVILGVFNYLKEDDLSVTITTEDVSNIASPVKLGDSVTINVPKNSAGSSSFIISPSKLGTMVLRFAAEATSSDNNEFADAVERSIQVNPEGVFKSKTVSKVFRRSTTEASASEAFVLSAFPEGISSNAIMDTFSSYVSVIGDIMGPSIQNVNKFVQIPMGCGEQNLLLLAPNVYVAEYLNSANKLTPALTKELSNNVISGYSRELTYFHSSGGVSAFGPQSDKSASLWLTAFCSRVFAAAKRASDSNILVGVGIDQNVLNGAVNFMMSTQSSSSGEFFEPGVVLHSEMQSGTNGDGFVLTSYVALCLIETMESLEDASTKTNAQNSITRALRYVSQSLDEGKKSSALANEKTAVYSVIVSVYALVSVCAEDSFNAYCDLATTWIRTVIEKIGNNEIDGAVSYGGTGSSNALKIETTAYVVLIYTKMRDSGNNFCYSALKYLLQKRNEFGGYGSTQDTVVALEALSQYAKLTREASSSGSGLTVTFPNEIGSPSFTVNASNFDTFNTKQIIQRGDSFSGKTNVSGTASGGGVAVASFIVRWYEQVDETEDTSGGIFTILITTNVVVEKTSGSSRRRRRVLLDSSKSSVEDAELLQLKTCVTGDDKQGMALLEIPSFSGFAPVESSIKNLDPEKIYIKRAEVNPTTNSVSLYIESFPKNKKLCVTFDLRRVADVQNVKDVSGARVSYYYNQNVYKNTVMKSTDLNVGRFPNTGISLEPSSGRVLRVSVLLTCVCIFSSVFSF
jgi:CD109 antigen